MAGIHKRARRIKLTCRILIELEGSDEPAWTYLEYQHAHILDTMRAMHSKSIERVKRESHHNNYLTQAKNSRH
jgi:hypothetical protein